MCNVRGVDSRAERDTITYNTRPRPLRVDFVIRDLILRSALYGQSLACLFINDVIWTSFEKKSGAVTSYDVCVTSYRRM